MEKNFFERRLNELNRPQKAINLDKHLEKYKVFERTQSEYLRTLKEKEKNDDKRIKEEIRQIQLNKLQRNMAFMEDWNQKGNENWKKNLNLQKIREKKDFDYNENMKNKKQNKLKALQELQRNEVIDALDQFENNLDKTKLEFIESEKKNSGTQFGLFLKLIIN